MSDSPNVSLVRRLYQARGNPDSLLAGMASLRLLMTPKEICLGCTRCNETAALTNHSISRMPAAAAG